MTSKRSSRRQFLSNIGIAFGATAAALPQPVLAFKTQPPDPALTDLMQEHGVLDRLLLIYDAAVQQAGKPKTRATALEAIKNNTTLVIQNFTGHHEKVEELAIFPIAGKKKDAAIDELVQTLVDQHRVATAITERIAKLFEGPKSANHQAEITKLAASYTRMYRAHASREDTVLFPFIRQTLSDAEYSELTAHVRDLESKMKQNPDLSTILASVSDIEKSLNIHDLSKFTAPMPSA